MGRIVDIVITYYTFLTLFASFQDSLNLEMEFVDIYWNIWSLLVLKLCLEDLFIPVILGRSRNQQDKLLIMNFIGFSHLNVFTLPQRGIQSGIGAFLELISAE